MLALWLTVLSGVALPVGDPRPPDSYLYEPAACLDSVLHGTPRVYCPQPGDIVLSTDHSRIICAGHLVAGSYGVHHSALVIARPDGRPAVLEAGPFNTLHIEILDPQVILTGHEQRGEQVWVRRRRVPLTAEQSARLTEWAIAQEGRPFAVLRMLGQLTPLRCRGPLRTYCLGQVHGQRYSYFCAELVTESLVAAGLVDSADARPCATYPRDLFLDRSSNHFINAHPILADCWFAPARWTSCIPATSPPK
jgi:hypothetical protein